MDCIHGREDKENRPQTHASSLKFAAFVEAHHRHRQRSPPPSKFTAASVGSRRLSSSSSRSTRRIVRSSCRNISRSLVYRFYYDFGLVEVNVSNEESERRFYKSKNGSQKEVNIETSKEAGKGVVPAAGASVAKPEAPVSGNKSETEKPAPVAKADDSASPLPPKAIEVAPDNEFEKRIRPEVIPASLHWKSFVYTGCKDISDYNFC
ncbi:uncharacterized protein A4U43_C04F12340 [Asparagus officinalis]|uniref:Uncharacterized protein n=1 Tax=Asparagus officinalis TaxID=4686 RepID=A0A5P1F237_ASPOF|nr:uncharacterized protein A4U43_C04F12340 [Asparagus officinalis]